MISSIKQENIDCILLSAEIKVSKMGEKTTVVFVKLENGFVIVESSSCVNPENYNEDIGREICLEKIKNKLWELERYRLQCYIYDNYSKGDLN